MIEQTKNAIEALKACGLARSEYSVRTPLQGRGQNAYYGDAEISLRCNRARQFELIDKLAERFVCHIVHRSGVFCFASVSTDYGHTGKDYIDLDVNLDDVDVATDEGFAAHMRFRAEPANLRLP